MTDATLAGRVEAPDTVFAADTVEEAVDRGLRELGLDRSETDVRVLRKGTRGFLGLGSRPAEVELVPRVRLAPAVLRLARDLLDRMGVPAAVDAVQVGLRVDVRIDGGSADGLLIGRRGETLEALQHVLFRMASREADGKLGGVRIDVGDYRRRREERLLEMARTLAERTLRTGRRTMTEPLPAGERRIVHRALAEEADIETHAGGSGLNKRVIILPAARGRRR
jgi:spoIIIJ-associated protein